jgi:hypothetical protein
LRSRAWLGAIEARIRGDLVPRWDAAVEKARELVEQVLRAVSNLDDLGVRDGR